uniref:Uncharacterized protein n=1 Tax=Panagrolaimus sp. ES5 TaxID=591445 RepID=A0AC34FWF0_9BILA
MGPAILRVIENFDMYDRDLTDLRNRVPPIPSNDTAEFRKSMFGGKILYFIDGVIIIWGGYLSTCALLTYLLANRTICRQYEYFNQTLRKHIESQSTKTKETNEILLLDHKIWNNDDVTIRVTAFNISYKIQTIDYASKEMSPIKAGNICYTLMKETNEILLLEPKIWNNDDVTIRETAFNISYKIQTIDYASKGMSPIKAGNICYTLLF